MLIVPITIFLVILLLYTAFNSLSKAMLILLNVPFGFIGGIIALLVSGIYLSVSAIIGFLAIFAIAILNGIVGEFYRRTESQIPACRFEDPA